MADAPSPISMENRIITSSGDSGEKHILDFSLKFNEESYSCTLKMIDNAIIKFILTSNKNSLLIYENEFDLSTFQMLNRNFKIYEDIIEIESDLVSYIKQNNLTISEIKEKEIILKLQLFSKKDNIAYIKLDKKKFNEKDKIKIMVEELNNKNNEIIELKNKINEIESKNII